MAGYNRTSYGGSLLSRKPRCRSLQSSRDAVSSVTLIIAACVPTKITLFICPPCPPPSWPTLPLLSFTLTASTLPSHFLSSFLSFFLLFSSVSFFPPSSLAHSFPPPLLLLLVPAATFLSASSSFHQRGIFTKL